ncbi:hypothetical protein C8F01DRAFT_1002497 [Mycena amicta]|nr:hypothetical protein C8F01DRAFT_1002497 [Mycena amicta]
MSDDESDVPEDSTVSVTLTIQLTHYTIVPATGPKGKPKEVKGNKTKEMTHLFTATEESYKNLLKNILLKTGETTLAEKSLIYSFQALVPPARAVKDALDIDNFQDYCELATKLIKAPRLKITTLVDMKKVEAGASQAVVNSSRQPGTIHDPNGGGTDGGISALDGEIARITLKLQKKWGNDHDKSYTYVGRDESFPLTPLMMRDWAIAIYDGLATINEPPNTSSFDPAKRKIALHPSRAHLNQPTAPVTGTSELAHVASIITGLSSFLGKRDPVTPSRSNHYADPSADMSPPTNTPSKLHSYLLHAKAKLGVPDALKYERDLTREGYGPDILHQVEDSKLAGLGIRMGDVIRLKNGAQRWWNGPDAKKRPRADSETSAPPRKMIAFEHRFPEGGGTRFQGPRIDPGDSNTRDLSTFYLCETSHQWLPIPRGYTRTPDSTSRSWVKNFRNPGKKCPDGARPWPKKMSGSQPESCPGRFSGREGYATRV